MEFTNRFSVHAPASLVWDFMLDAQEVAPCVPGAQITETVDETHFKGTVKVKLGAVQMQYRGDLTMEPDESARTITLRAKGTETRGSGGASGTFTTHISDAPDGGTDVEIVSRVDVTGRVAQFGRGIMQDVANRLIKEFAACLEQKIQTRAAAADGSTPGAAENSATEDEVTPVVSETAPASAGARADASETNVTETAVATRVEPARATAPSPIQAPSQSSAELNMTSLLVSVLRSRIAMGLRYIAKRIEPE